MARQHYRLQVRYSPSATPAPRWRRRMGPVIARAADARVQPAGPRAAAIRGILIGAPVAALLWAPLLWGASHLF